MSRSVAAPKLRTKEERDRFVEQFLPLVRYVIARMPVTMPATLSRDDFYSVGVMGLLHAATNFDPTRGASFKTFAYTAIRGAILDEIRKHDPVPRSRRDRLRQIERATGALRSKLGRTPTLEEIAETLGSTVEELDADLLALHTCKVLSLDDARPSFDGEDAPGLSQHLVSGNTLDPSDEVSRGEQVDRLAKAIAELPEMDRNVIVLYHYESLYLREIGEILGVTESRISQILTRATARLRLKLREEGE
jgi:RNA polymerase sigma factor for flagellar operon FliA